MPLQPEIELDSLWCRRLFNAGVAIGCSFAALRSGSTMARRFWWISSIGVPLVHTISPLSDGYMKAYEREAYDSVFSDLLVRLIDDRDRRKWLVSHFKASREIPEYDLPPECNLNSRFVGEEMISSIAVPAAIWLARTRVVGFPAFILIQSALAGTVFRETFFPYCKERLAAIMFTHWIRDRRLHDNPEQTLYFQNGTLNFISGYRVSCDEEPK